jgi:hypothetical protein
MGCLNMYVCQAPKERYSLALLPTPVHRWRVAGVPQDLDLWVKRDDLSGMQLSGNKVETSPPSGYTSGQRPGVSSIQLAENNRKESSVPKSVLNHGVRNQLLGVDA